MSLLGLLVRHRLAADAAPSPRAPPVASAAVPRATHVPPDRPAAAAATGGAARGNAAGPGS